MSATGHESVLCREAVEYWYVQETGKYLDCTGGLGGHSAALLARLAPTAQLWICDYHKPSVEGLKSRFAHDARVSVISSRFSRVFDNLNFSFDGILADFGISSPQLEDPTLGIGFAVELAPLDMRICEDAPLSASALLKTVSRDELADLFFFFGGERAARKIAAAIVMDRDKGKFYETTSELKALCERVLGRFYRGKKIHPATKVFQALRIAVNAELDEVKTLLDEAPRRLNVGGHFVTIAFHEGEDALVKKAFRDLAARDEFVLPVRKAIKPSDDEVKNNPRSRSARLRILEKL